MRHLFRKMLSLLLALVMVGAMGVSLAEGSEEKTGFLEALKSWKETQKANPSDYSFHFESGDGVQLKNLEATLRSSDGLKEIEIPGIVKIQKNGDQLVLQNLTGGFPGATLVLDLESLGKLAQGTSFSKEELQKDVSSLKRIGLRFLTDILMPFVTVQQSSKGTVMHFEADEQDLTVAIVSFIDRLLEEGTDVERLLSRYSAFLRLPGTVEELQAVWAVMRENFRLPMMEISLDLAMDPDQKSTSLAGTIAVGGEYLDLSYEMIQEDAAVSCIWNISGTLQGRPVAQNISMLIGEKSFRATIDVGPGKPLHGDFSFEILENGYTARANLDAGEDRVYGVEMGWYNYPEANSYYGYLAKITPETGSEPLIEIIGDLIPGGTAGTLTLPETTVHYELIRKEAFLRGSFQLQRGRNDYVSLRVMAYPGDQQIRVRADLDSSDRRLRGTMNLEASAEEFEVKVTRPGEGMFFYERVETQKTENGGTLHVEYMNRFLANIPLQDEAARRMLQQNTPAVIDIAKDGNHLTAEMNWYSQTQTLSANLDLTAQEGCQLQEAEANLLFEDQLKPETDLHYRATYVPGVLTLIDGTNFYELTRTADDPTQLSWKLQRNRCFDLLNVNLQLLEDQTFFASFWTDAYAANFSVTPMEKTLIEPIDTTFAITIDEQMLQLLFSQLTFQ